MKGLIALVLLLMVLVTVGEARDGISLLKESINSSVASAQPGRVATLEGVSYHSVMNG